MTVQHETTVDGIAVEWEMDGNAIVWSVVGDTECGGPTLTDVQRNRIDEELWKYMVDWWASYDDY